MTVNQLGLEVIKSFEQCRLAPYKDAAGKWTIGWGHLLPVSPALPVSAVDEHLRAVGWHAGTDTVGITQDQADRLLVEDVTKAARAVDAMVEVPLSANQASALTSLVYNIGKGAFGASTILKRVNAQQWAEAQEEFHRWREAGGRVLNGLVRRRAVEAWLFGLGVEFTPEFTWSVSAGSIDADTLRAAANAAPGSVYVLMQPQRGGVN